MESAGKSSPLSALATARMFFRDRGASHEFAVALAERAVRQLPGDVDGRLLLDLGCGPGIYTEALERAGAIVISSEFDMGELNRARTRPKRPLVADGRDLPFADGSFECVVCSNVLEHTPNPFKIIDEIARVLQPSGWAYISWTNWLSPWGGHAVAPLHYLGATRSVRIWTRMFGPPRGRNLPGNGVWPSYIGRTLRHVTTNSSLTLLQAYPRYWPWLKVILKIPGLREVAAWNCVIVVRRTNELGT